MDPDDLLHTPMPAFSEAEALNAVHELFGVRATGGSPLGSERDQLWLLPDTSAGPVVAKFANLAERPSTLDMENQALRHLAEVDPGLPVPRLVRDRDGNAVAVAAGGHLVRLMTVVPGQQLEGRPVSPELAERMGAVCARVSVGLQGFFHERAGRRLQWDIRVQRGPRADDPLAAARARIGSALAATQALPSGVQHADVTLTNILADEAGVVTGVVDFGDMHHTAAVCDLAVSLTSVLRNTSEVVLASAWELAAAFLDGYQRVRPLLPAEAAVIGPLVLARLVTTLDISRARVGEHPANRAYIAQYDASTERLLALLSDLDDHELGGRFARLTGMRVSAPIGELGVRRDRVLGGRLAPTFYREPLGVEAGEGPWLVDTDGRRYLDAYNNVAVAGHTHPAVNQAVVRQLRTLNTHSRYLHPAIVELAERLTATMPAGLDTCVFVTSGSEAVDLAWRMARAFTGGAGTMVAQWAYHGISARTIDFSTNEWRDGVVPADVATFVAPHADPGERLDAAQARRRVATAAADLVRRGVRPGLLVADPQFTSEGILDAPPDFMAGLVEGAHAAGALFLADEVQSGFGRSGPGLWRFASQAITPDLVTMGKPMAAGLPVAAVVTRREIADAYQHEYFSTFAGSPVACAAGLAVLDVLADRNLPAQAVRVGEYLRGRLREVAADFPVVSEVRGYGLIAGVDLRTAGRAYTTAVVEELRRRGVLAGSTGRGGDVLKIRPPLVWREEHVDLLVDALRPALAG